MLNLKDLPLNSTISEGVQENIKKHFNAVVPGISELCQKSGISDSVAEAVIRDFNDILQDGYKGLHQTKEGIRELCAATSIQQWGELKSPVLDEVITEYNSIGALEIQPAEVIEVAKHFEKDDYMRLCETTFSALSLFEVMPHDDVRATAMMLLTSVSVRHVFLLENLFLDFGVTDEQLRGIVPVALQRDKKESAEKYATLTWENNAIFLKEVKRSLKGEARKNLKQVLAGLDTTDKATEEEQVRKNYAETEDRQRTVVQYGNITQLLSRTLMTGSNTEAWPLYEEIQKRQLAAAAAREKLEKLKEETDKKPEDIENALKECEAAEGKVCTMDYVMKAFKGIVRLASDGARLPHSVGTEFVDFGHFPVNEFVRLCLGRKTNEKGALNSLKKLQQDGILRAINTLSALKLCAQEDISKPYKYRDENGKIIKGSKIITQSVYFQPAVFTVHTSKDKSENNEETAQERIDFLGIQIHKIIADGRRGENVEIEIDGKKTKCRLLKPIKHIFTKEQFDSFVSDGEIAVLNKLKFALKSKEEELLELLYGYKDEIDFWKKQLLNKESELKNFEERERVNGKKKDETEKSDKYKELKNSIEETRKTLVSAKTKKTKHTKRDIEGLQRTLYKAYKTGVICSYYREPPLSEKSNKQEPVWYWEHPTNRKKV